jgi:S1-C subfamily serine protease
MKSKESKYYKWIVYALVAIVGLVFIVFLLPRDRSAKAIGQILAGLIIVGIVALLRKLSDWRRGSKSDENIELSSLDEDKNKSEKQITNFDRELSDRSIPDLEAAIIPRLLMTKLSFLKATYKYILIFFLALIGLIVFSKYLNHFWGGGLSPQEIAATTKKSLVMIVTQDNEGRDIAFGSGFFFGDDYVATNLHVFKWAHQGYIKLVADSINYKIDKVVGFDLNHDLCVFTVNTSKSPTSPLVIDSSGDVRMGDEIFVCGNPKGLEGTFSRGIVSAIHQEGSMIQIDAPISSGSSGGPVVNDRGEVIGIATATFIGGQNLNFAIPVKYLASVTKKHQLSVSDIGALSVTDREIDKIKGTVHKVVEKHAVLNFKEELNKYIEDSICISNEKSYDRKGNLIEASLYTPKCTLSAQYVYEYDQNGILSKSIRKNSTTREDINRSYSEQEKLGVNIKSKKDRMPYSYKKCNKMKDRDSEEFRERCDYKLYDSSGNLKEEELKSFFSLPIRIKAVYTYDEGGNLQDTKYYCIETQKHDGGFKSGELVYETKYKYHSIDKMGNWTKRYRYSYWSDSDYNYDLSSAEYREIAYY